MKRLLLFSLAIVLLTSCEFYYVEPRYDARTKVIGTHDVEEYSETFNDNENYSIQIGNFYGVDIRVYATVSYDKIDIYRQVTDGYEIEGVGTIYTDEIHFNYQVKDLVTGVRTDYCEATAWRY